MRRNGYRLSFPLPPDTVSPLPAHRLRRTAAEEHYGSGCFNLLATCCCAALGFWSAGVSHECVLRPVLQQYVLIHIQQQQRCEELYEYTWDDGGCHACTAWSTRSVAGYVDMIFSPWFRDRCALVSTIPSNVSCRQRTMALLADKIKITSTMFFAGMLPRAIRVRKAITQLRYEVQRR